MGWPTDFYAFFTDCVFCKTVKINKFMNFIKFNKFY